MRGAPPSFRWALGTCSPDRRCSSPPGEASSVPPPPPGLSLGARGEVARGGAPRFPPAVTGAGPVPAFRVHHPRRRRRASFPRSPRGPFVMCSDRAPGPTGHTGEEQCRPPAGAQPAGCRGGGRGARSYEMHRWKHIYIYNKYVYRRTHTYLYVCMNAYVYLYTYMYTHIYVCACMDGYRCAHTQLPAHTGRSDRRSHDRKRQHKPKLFRQRQVPPAPTPQTPLPPLVAAANNPSPAGGGRNPVSRYLRCSACPAR